MENLQKLKRILHENSLTCLCLSTKKYSNNKKQLQKITTKNHNHMIIYRLIFHSQVLPCIYPNHKTKKKLENLKEAVMSNVQTANYKVCFVHVAGGNKQATYKYRHIYK